MSAVLGFAPTVPAVAGQSTNSRQQDSVATQSSVNEVVQEVSCRTCEEQYRFALRSDGRAEKTTTTRVAFAVYRRQFRASLDRETFNHLAEFIRRERFLELPGYRGKPTSAGVFKTTAVNLNGVHRSIENLDGGAPAFLTRISDEVDRVANTLRWMAVEATPPSPDMIRGISLGRSSMVGSERIALQSDGTATRTVTMRSGADSSSTGSISVDRFHVLAALVMREGFFTLADAYSDPNLVDGGAVHTSVASDTATKNVEDRLGLGPANLKRIEEAVKAVVDVIQWTPSAR